jgi:hypothetical protein
MPIVQIKHGYETLLDYQADTLAESTLVLAQQLSAYSMSFGVRVMAKWIDTAKHAYCTIEIRENENGTPFSVFYTP